MNRKPTVATVNGHEIKIITMRPQFNSPGFVCTITIDGRPVHTVRGERAAREYANTCWQRLRAGEDLTPTDA